MPGIDCWKSTQGTVEIQLWSGGGGKSDRRTLLQRQVNGSKYLGPRVFLGSLIPRHSMGLPYLPISWDGARGVNGAAYMAVPWSVWDHSP